MSIRVSSDAESLAAQIARQLLDRLEHIQSEGRTAHIALTGGTIAGAVHREVARLSGKSAVDWQRVELWWGDERFVAADSADRNALQAREDFIDAVGVGPDQVHEMPAAGELDLEAAAHKYSQEVREHGSGQFDIVMLGMGPDGHIASLFPGHRQLAVSDQIAVGVEDSPKPPPQRITLTFSALGRTRAVWFLVSGEEKAAAVARAHGAGTIDDTPAVGVSGENETCWFLDEAAASQLPAL